MKRCENLTKQHMLAAFLASEVRVHYAEKLVARAFQLAMQREYPKDLCARATAAFETLQLERTQNEALIERFRASNPLRDELPGAA